MRVSTKDGDVGYRLWTALAAAGREQWIRVYLDDVLQGWETLITADDRMGIVIHARVDDHGKAFEHLTSGKVKILLDADPAGKDQTFELNGRTHHLNAKGSCTVNVSEAFDLIKLMHERGYQRVLIDWSPYSSSRPWVNVSVAQ